MLRDLFRLRGTLNHKTASIIMASGLIFIIAGWSLITATKMVPPELLPSPWAVLYSFKELHFQDALVRNTIFSIKLNLLGYLEAIAICIPLGFMIGLYPLFREMFKKYLDAIRFIPLTAVTGLFIVWFGIDNNMKVQFLAFGIIVYLLPVVVIRVLEVDDIYVQTVKTLSVKDWPIIKRVFIPAVLSKVFEDIRVLVAISWTYIIVAELVNKSGGIGALAYLAARQSRIDKVFAILLVIIFIGFIQDKIFMWLDKAIFPHKYQGAQNG